MNLEHLWFNKTSGVFTDDFLTIDDFDGMAAEVLEAAKQLVAEHPKVQAIVLECTNMPPFSRLVEREIKRKVWDILTLGRWLYNGAASPDWKRIQTAG